MSGYNVSYADFLDDPLRTDIYLVEVEPYCLASGSVQALYYATDSYISSGQDTPSNQYYLPRATVALNVQQQIVQPGTIATQERISGGEIRLGQSYGDADNLRSDYRWNGRAIRVVHVGYSPAAEAWVTRANGREVFSGEVIGLQSGLDEVALAVQPVSNRLSDPIQTSSLIGQPWMLRYDGVNVYAETAGPEPKLDLRNDFTAEFFIYLNLLPSALSLILGWRGTTYPWGIFVSPENRLRFRDSSSIFYTVGMTFEAKRWYHVAVACDSSGTNFYIHDVNTGVTTAATDADDNTGRAAPSSATFGIGGSLSAGDRIDGYITQARVWSRKRTESEITEARFRRLTTAEALDPDLKGLWRGEDGTTEDGTNDRMSDSSTIVTTQTTLSAVASGNKYTRASGSFVDDGWVAGMRGLASAFGTSGNNGLFTVSTVDATNLAIAGLTLADESSVVAAMLQSAPLEILGTTNINWHQALEGSPDAAGTLRPLAYGRCESVPGILVGPALPTYLLASNPIQSIDAVYVGGVEHELGTAYTDLVAFLSATTDPAKYDTLITSGEGAYVRLGSQPSLPLTVDLKGDATGASYVETAGAIARRVITTRGTAPLTDPDDLDTSSFSDLDTANSAPVGVYALGGESVAEIASMALAAINASGFIDRSSGLFRVSRFGGVAGSAVAVIDERDIISMEPQATDPPIYAIVLRYRRQWTKLELEGIAGTVLEAGDPIVARLTQEWFTVRVEDPDVLSNYPRAGTLTLDCLLATESDALAEAQRLLPLYAGEALAFKVRVAEAPLRAVVEGDVIEVTFAEYDQTGATLQRLGLDPGQSNSTFIIMALAPVIEPDDPPAVEGFIWRGGA